MQEHGGFAEDYSKVGKCDDFLKGSQWEHGDFAQDYQGRGMQ
jgi:hypothetical protein